MVNGEPRPMPESRGRRSALACKHCHDRRVRCDASVKGLPCTNCKDLPAQRCEFIKSKRSRGLAGRFVSSQAATPPTSEESPPTADDKDRDPVAAAARPSKRLKLTTQPPNFFLDLKNLLSGDQRDQSHVFVATEHGQEDQSSPISHLTTDDRPQDDILSAEKPSFPGESWYLSFILQNTNNDYDSRHQPIRNPTQKESSPRASMLPDGTPGGANASSPRHSTWPADLPPQQTTHHLIDAYFTRFHSFCPIINKSRFMRDLDQGTFSVPLVRSVLFVATIHCDAKILYRMGYESRNEAGDHFFGKAKADFDAGLEKDRLTLLQISFLLHYWWGRPTSFKDSTWWLAGAINAAQAMCMNRTAKRSKMDPECRKLWRRIWWLLYIRDRQLSISLGKPMIINDNDCDIERPEREDFWDESLETALYIMSQARLSMAASRIAVTYFSPAKAIGPLDTPGQREISASIESILGQWLADLPPELGRHTGKSSHPLTLGLYINYHYYQIIFHQMVQRASNKRLIGSEESLLTLEAARNITSLVEELVMESEPYFFPLICVTAIFASMTVQFVESHTADVQRSRMIQRELKSNLLSLRQFEDVHNLACWIRKSFTSFLHSSQESSLSTHAGTSAPAPSAVAPSQQHSAHSDASFSGATTAVMSVPGPDTAASRDQMGHLGQGQPSWDLPFQSERPSRIGTPSLQGMPPHGMQTDGLPDLTHFETLQYLADLGMAGFHDHTWDGADLPA